MNVYNCHAHIFNLDCAPEHFLDTYTGGKFFGSILRQTLGVPRLRDGVLWILKKMGASALPAAEKYAAFLRIGTDVSQATIFERELVPNYPAGTRFVILAINFDMMGAGTARLNYESQLWQLLEVRNRNPNTCLPFLGIDVRMGTSDQIKEFAEKWLKRGFIGIKLYPALGFYPFDSRLDGVYALAQDNGIPVMTHCTRGGIFYQGGITDYLRSPELPASAQGRLYGEPLPLALQQQNTNDVFCDNFLDPRAYDFVLSRFPELQLCLAHYGGDEEIILAQTAAKAKAAAPAAATGATPNVPDNWYEGIRWLMRKYPNVYTDVSYTLAQEASFGEAAHSFFELVYQDLTAPGSPYADRLLFGTDFFMVTKEKEEKVLAVELMNALLDKDAIASKAAGTASPITSWRRLATLNPACYLHSTYYTPVERLTSKGTPCKRPFLSTQEPGIPPTPVVTADATSPTALAPLVPLQSASPTNNA